MQVIDLNAQNPSLEKNIHQIEKQQEGMVKKNDLFLEDGLELAIRLSLIFVLKKFYEVAKIGGNTTLKKIFIV